MEKLIADINSITGFRVELYYYSDTTKEGYKAGLYGDNPTEDYVMKEIYDDPLCAIKRLAKEYDINVKI